MMLLNASAKLYRKVFLCEKKGAVTDNQVLPTAVLFRQKGTWGILFDCACDPEHGIAVMFDETGINAGPSDMIL